MFFGLPDGTAVAVCGCGRDWSGGEAGHRSGARRLKPRKARFCAPPQKPPDRKEKSDARKKTRAMDRRMDASRENAAEQRTASTLI